MIEFLTWSVLGYFIALNGVYLLLNLLSAYALHRGNLFRVIDDLPQVFSTLEPAISILVPAFNEETTITASIHSLLQLEYQEFEIVVINDGSKDGTLDVLKQAFSLLPFPEAYHLLLETEPIHAIYRSTSHPNLRVIDKANGGKADSLNAGINASRYPLFCAVDADSILQRNSLQLVVRPFLRNPHTVAAGGTVRAANGCHVKDGFLTDIDLPRNPWALLQVVEYLRAFLFGRLGWSRLNAMLIISGAFGVFRKSVVIDVGGYRTDTVGEDMELVVRIHHVMRTQRKPYQIEFVPDPVCWTEVPEDMRTLKNQRIRWQRGLSESLSSHWGLMFHRHGGLPGWVAFPFMVLFEWLGPVIELGGYLFMCIAYAFGFISWEAFFVFFFVALGLGVLLSASGLLLEEMSFSMYRRPRHLAVLALVVVAENFGYRQLNTYWRMLGFLQWISRREGHWGTMKRKGSWKR